MDYIFYYQNEDGEPVKVVFYSDKHEVDKVLDQILVAKFKMITEEKFIELTKDIVLMTIDIKDEFSGVKIGELTLEEEDLTNVEVIG